MSRWYKWNPITDEVKPFKYDILSNKEEWLRENLEYTDNGSKGVQHVGKTFVRDVWISTVFLNMDHGWHEGAARPILFETMIFDVGARYQRLHYDTYQERYHSPEEARIGHKRIVDISRRLLCKSTATQL